MAIYYIDPHTTVNGTGTWASPWSLITSHTGLVTGDEIRIKGIALTSLLTATEYTVSVTSNYQLTITAGGGLGADFAAFDVCYLPDYDTFFKIGSVTGNVIALGATGAMLPINDTSAIANIKVRRVNLTSYSAINSTAFFLTGSYASTNNITISDCWINETTRVTDGTVKTLLNNFNPGSVTVYLDNTSSSGNPENWTVNLNNTHVLCGNLTTASAVTAYIYASKSTYNINQIFGTQSNGGGFSIGTSVSSTPIGNTVTIKSLQCGALLQPSYSRNLTLNITDYICFYIDVDFGNTGSNLQYCQDFTINIGKKITYTLWNSTIFNIALVDSGTINLINGIDLITNASMNYLLYGINGLAAINYGSGCIFNKNRKASIQTTFSYGYTGGSNLYAGKAIIPNINIPPGCTVTTMYNFNSTPNPPNINRSYYTPQICNIELSSIPSSSQLPRGDTFSNKLVTARDGGSPVEILGIQNHATTSAGSATNHPNVTTDVTVYKTTGPSLKSYLATRSITYWRNLSGYPKPIAVKNIKIPVTTGTSYTVSGWIRTDDTAYLTGDCRMAIIHNNTEFVSQDMTTACINAWEQFTLTFTAPQTCEMNLAWEMYYSNGAKSYWLDDLTIS